MSLRRLAAGWSPAVVVLLLATAAVAAPPSAPESSSSPRSEPRQSELSGICYESLCDTDADCWNACSGATSAVCSNSVCQYTYGTPGGGGGGGHGPYCDARLCWDDSQCVCGSYYGYCGADGTCH